MCLSRLPYRTKSLSKSLRPAGLIVEQVLVQAPDIAPAFSSLDSNTVHFTWVSDQRPNEREEASSMASEVSQFTVIPALLLNGEANRTIDPQEGDSCPVSSPQVCVVRAETSSSVLLLLA